MNGELTAEWKQHLAAKDFGSMDDDASLAYFWQSAIDDFPSHELPGTESERIGEYLNECYWDVNGAFSVSDPVLGITESPLGDATLLPVLALKDLKFFEPPVSNWVGVTPTHSGFQFLQEAYKEGKWFGQKPKFKLPKTYRNAGVK